MKVDDLIPRINREFHPKIILNISTAQIPEEFGLFHGNVCDYAIAIEVIDASLRILTYKTNTSSKYRIVYSSDLAGKYRPHLYDEAGLLHYLGEILGTSDRKLK